MRGDWGTKTVGRAAQLVAGLVDEHGGDPLIVW